MASEFEDAMRSQIAALEERRTKLASEVTRIDGQLAGLRQALSLFLGEPQAAKSGTRNSRVPDPAKSESWAFVLDLLGKTGPAGISADEIHEQAELAGHIMARNTLSSNLSNASQEGVIQRVSRGRYRKHANANGHAPAELDAEAETSRDEPPSPQTVALENQHQD